MKAVLYITYETKDASHSKSRAFESPRGRKLDLKFISGVRTSPPKFVEREGQDNSLFEYVFVGFSENIGNVPLKIPKWGCHKDCSPEQVQFEILMGQGRTLGPNCTILPEDLARVEC